ncbi:diguanylate cyclase [Nitratifractor sp.]|uniref:GGDEF domain-containing protein n=1 Tax=Nitratifractor sp. TaxID=2268144 RepID=UPI0025E0B873|nr:diguanylate cyclase [Nitratifractor sp.]
MTIQQRIILFFTLITILLLTVVMLMWYRLSLQADLTRAQENRFESYKLAVHLKNTADQLTRMARTYTLTDDPRYRKFYQHILAIRDGREIRPTNYNILFWDLMTPKSEFHPPREGKAVSFRQLIRQSRLSSDELAKLRQANHYADQLANLDNQAFHLMELADIDDDLSQANRLAAQQLLYGSHYRRIRAKMAKELSDLFQMIDRRTSAQVQRIARQEAIINDVLIVLVLLLLMLALLSWFHSRKKIVDPLKELIRWTQRLEKGKFQFNCTINGRDEISQLAHSFSKMADTLHKSLNDLNHKAHTDRLTNLPNRRYLEIEMERMHLAVKYYGMPCNIILLDLDHFKQINDRYGHDMGDQVLRHFAHLLLSEVQLPHAACRWGGEEFLIMTKNLTLDQAVALAEKIRQRVETTEFPGNLHVTLSAGVASLEADLELREGIQRADEALYQAKAQGRNRVLAYRASDQ